MAPPTVAAHPRERVQPGGRHQRVRQHEDERQRDVARLRVVVGWCVSVVSWEKYWGNEMSWFALTSFGEVCCVRLKRAGQVGVGRTLARTNQRGIEPTTRDMERVVCNVTWHFTSRSAG